MECLKLSMAPLSKHSWVDTVKAAPWPCKAASGAPSQPQPTMFPWERAELKNSSKSREKATYGHFSRTTVGPRSQPFPPLSPKHTDSRPTFSAQECHGILYYLRPSSEAGYIRNFRKKERE